MYIQYFWQKYDFTIFDQKQNFAIFCKNVILQYLAKTDSIIHIYHTFKSFLHLNHIHYHSDP